MRNLSLSKVVCVSALAIVASTASTAWADSIIPSSSEASAPVPELPPPAEGLFVCKVSVSDEGTKALVNQGVAAFDHSIGWGVTAGDATDVALDACVRYGIVEHCSLAGCSQYSQ